MNKIHILNPPSEKTVTQVYGPKGQGVSALILTISIYIASTGAKKFSFMNERLVTVKVVISELELLSCTNLFGLIELVTDSKGNDYFIKLDEIEHTTFPVYACISIPSVVQLLSKAILFQTGNTVIFELEDHIREFQSRIGPLFYEASPLEQKPTMEISNLDSES